MKLSQVCQVNPPKRINIPVEQEISFVPMEAVTTDGYLDVSRTITVSKVKNYSVFQNGDVLFAKITPCMENGKGCIVKGLLNGFGAGSTELIVLRPNPDLVISEWIHYFLSQKRFRLQCQHHMTGSAGQKRVPPKYLADCEIPIPSICDQKRIVAHIEELFSQLDSGVETLKKTKQQLEVYRQAVLKEAFDRAKRNKTVEVSEIVEEIRIGPFGTMLHKSDYVENGIPVVNPQHIKHGNICPSNSNMISFDKAAELSSYTLQMNDIVMGRRGEMGRVAPVTEKEAGWICGTGSIRLRMKSEFDAAFYAKILSGPDVVHYLEENATGTTMKNLNEEIVKHIPVPYVTREMQDEFSRCIDAQLSLCGNIEQTVSSTLLQADAMRQSIMKMAFERGQ